MQQQDLLLAGHPASIERSRERALRHASDTDLHDAHQAGGEIVDLGVRLKAEEQTNPIGDGGQVRAEQILRTFNTWSFKREQPSDVGLMVRVISHAISRAEPLSFVLYWGKGPRCSAAEPDIACLDFLAAFAERVKQGYPTGARLNLVFTDTHAELNGHPQTRIWKYFHEIDAQARLRGFSSCSLGELVCASNLSGPVGADEEPIEETTMRKLIASARKWYRGSATPEEGARTYYRMNMRERRAVEAAFPESIFITFNGSDLRALFPPHMPIFYMYSLRRGFSVKPWFLPLDAAVCTASSCSCAETALNDRSARAQAACI